MGGKKDQWCLCYEIIMQWILHDIFLLLYSNSTLCDYLSYSLSCCLYYKQEFWSVIFKMHSNLTASILFLWWTGPSRWILSINMTRLSNVCRAVTQIARSRDSRDNRPGSGERQDLLIVESRKARQWDVSLAIYQSLTSVSKTRSRWPKNILLKSTAQPPTQLPKGNVFILFF